MAERNLVELLEQLRGELSRIEALDETGRELLRALDADIQQLLERSGEGESDESLLQRLQDGIDHFEVTHPNLTAALTQMLNTLNNAGI